MTRKYPATEAGDALKKSSMAVRRLQERINGIEAELREGRKVVSALESERHSVARDLRAAFKQQSAAAARVFEEQDNESD